MHGCMHACMQDELGDLCMLGTKGARQRPDRNERGREKKTFKGDLKHTLDIIEN